MRRRLSTQQKKIGNFFFTRLGNSMFVELDSGMHFVVI